MDTPAPPNTIDGDKLRTRPVLSVLPQDEQERVIRASAPTQSESTIVAPVPVHAQDVAKPAAEELIARARERTMSRYKQQPPPTTSTSTHIDSTTKPDHQKAGFISAIFDHLYDYRWHIISYGAGLVLGWFAFRFISRLFGNTSSAVVSPIATMADAAQNASIPISSVPSVPVDKVASALSRFRANSMQVR